MGPMDTAWELHKVYKSLLLPLLYKGDKSLCALDTAWELHKICTRDV